MLFLFSSSASDFSRLTSGFRFYRAVLNAGRSSHERGACLSVRLSLCLSVRPSVKRVHCDKTEERSVQIFIPYTKDHLA